MEAVRPEACRRCGGKGIYEWKPGSSGICYGCNGTGFYKPKTEPKLAVSPFNGGVIDLSGTQPRTPRRNLDPKLPDGFYTVVLPDETWVTLKVSEWKNKEDARVVAWLYGSDNTSDYRGFASFSYETGQGGIWKNSNDEGHARQIAALDKLCEASRMDPGPLREAFAMKSGRCARCGHVLTVPASLHRGLGPDCADKM